MNERVKTYLPLATVILGGVALYFAAKGIFRGSGTNAVDEARKGAGTPTLSPTQLASMADQIEAAGLATLGTDEDSIFDVFSRLKNQADLDGLIVAFGERRIEFTLATSTLPAFLSSELSTSELEKLRKLLAQKGISI